MLAIRVDTRLAPPKCCKEKNFITKEDKQLCILFLYILQDEKTRISLKSQHFGIKFVSITTNINQVFAHIG
jgi:hypothetical protein